MKMLKENAASLCLVAFSFGLGLALRGQLPPQLPSHYGLSGMPDHYSSTTAMLFLLPGFSLLMAVLMPLLIRVSPPGYQMEDSRRGLARVVLSIVVLLSIMHAGILLSNLPGSHLTMPSFLCAGFGLNFLILGNLLGKVERNFFIGIRTPWTLASERNWLATHRFAGKLMVVCGIMLLILAFFATNLALAILLILVTTMAPLLYSYWFYRTQELNLRS